MECFQRMEEPHLHAYLIYQRCFYLIIDLGPEGGNLGGEIVATGTPEEVAKNKNSYTGEFLAKILK